MGEIAQELQDSLTERISRFFPEDEQENLRMLVNPIVTAIRKLEDK